MPEIEMDFGEALHALKHGQRVARKGWGAEFLIVAPTRGDETLPQIRKCTRRDSLGMFWASNQIDILAEDWVLVE